MREHYTADKAISVFSDCVQFYYKQQTNRQSKARRDEMVKYPVVISLSGQQKMHSPYSPALHAAAAVNISSIIQSAHTHRPGPRDMSDRCQTDS